MEGLVEMGDSNETEQHIYRQIGFNIYCVRTRMRVTQVALAAKTGIRNDTISNIEHGRRRVSLYQFLKIAETLNLDVNTLLRGTPFEKTN